LNTTTDLPLLPYEREVENLFGAQSPFHTAIDKFKFRQSQMEMAKSIANAIATHDTLIAEAGTGTGKTFAYLVPALLWGGKVIISTGTKNLQDQLFLRDIPTVKQALLTPVHIALLKGRANYVCHYHLERTLENGRLTAREDIGYLRNIARFAKTTLTGDKAELDNVPENALIWNLVTSTRENCLGSECPAYQNCFVMKARKEAQQADIVVVNHHLFFADIALKDTGVAELLPSANTIIFDEAHQLPDTATLFFGETISSSHIMELCRDVLAEGITHARDAEQWGNVISPLERATRDFRLCIPEDNQKLGVHQIAPSNPFFDHLNTVCQELSSLVNILEKHAERAETLSQCHIRANELLHQLIEWQKQAQIKTQTSQNKNEEFILWVEAFSSSMQLHRTPLLIAPIFAKQREGEARTWIFTSATLAVKNNFDHYTHQMGLENARTQSWPSPFDYNTQALLYAPQNMPLPHMPHYTESVVDKALPIIKAAQGRTFLLCTTLRAVNIAATYLKEKFQEHNLTFPIFVQGESNKTDLLNRFRQAGNGILIGSQSFWEGIDVRGDSLSLVIIDKLPFSPPDDPILAARIALMEQQGLNGFMSYQLPQAIISLKQGAGRLIRDETDQGVLMICDPRLISKPYGRKIWQSLPSFKRTREEKEVILFFEKIKAVPI
jgi:ATP-dependent DNA helicase DinG